MLLALVMCLALCACGWNAEPAAEEPAEEEVVEITPEPTSEPTPEPTAVPEPVSEPESVRIEITLDNWDEYFEHEVRNIDDVIWMYFQLKEEYRELIDFDKDNRAAFTFSYDAYHREYEGVESFIAEDYLVNDLIEENATTGYTFSSETETASWGGEIPPFFVPGGMEYNLGGPMSFGGPDGDGVYTGIFFEDYEALTAEGQIFLLPREDVPEEAPLEDEEPEPLDIFYYNEDGITATITVFEEGDVDGNPVFVIDSDDPVFAELCYFFTRLAAYGGLQFDQITATSDAGVIRSNSSMLGDDTYIDGETGEETTDRNEAQWYLDLLEQEDEEIYNAAKSYVSITLMEYDIVYNDGEGDDFVDIGYDEVMAMINS